ncbi:putative E6 early protein [Equus caballus papillomavirus 6]|uniref:Protein E6 n=1 Tax=Equus caballus papillomavirus 6 TaxID=1235427 RepID=M4HXI4_9PAPI|nr:putative E6 early protein [Equus caballus papillomavirus 6]AFU07682.1 putative E6 early protein [Equus caballus papillomavirus 6]
MDDPEDVWKDYSFLSTCPCRFCSARLSRLDLVGFRDKKWRLIWRNGRPFAACAACVRALLFIERTTYPTVWKSIKQVEELEGKPICKIHVTCTYCGCVLGKDELLLKAWEGRSLRRVRNRWCGSCFDCNHPDPDPEAKTSGKYHAEGETSESES